MGKKFGAVHRKEKIKSEQFQKETVLLPLLAGLALVMILAAVIAGIRSISSASADGLMESQAASASDSSAQENTDGKNADGTNQDGEATEQTVSATVIVTGKAAKKMAETAESVTENDSVTEHDTEESGNTKAGSESADTQPDTEKQADRRNDEYGK